MNDISKSIEIELKFILSGTQSKPLVVNYLRQNKYVVDKINPLKNVDIYMDTTDWMLLKNKLSLRYRLSNDTALYTLKSVSEIEDGVAKRMETEVVLEKPVHSPTRDPDKNTQETGQPSHLSPQVDGTSSHSYKTLHRYLVNSPEGTKFELSFDSSSFSADPLFKPERAPQVYQLEAEITDGPEAAVETMAKLLSDTFHLPNNKTKLQIGDGTATR